MLKRSSRVFLYYNQLFFTYRIKYDRWLNKYMDNQLWHILEEWYVGVEFKKKWFEIDRFYYDGHTRDAITICGLSFFRAYSYESEPIPENECVPNPKIVGIV